MPDGALVSSYLQGAGGAVGMLGGLDDKPAEIKANGGADPVTFAYSDFGVNQVGYCIVATKDTVAKNPDLVKRFMAATVKAYKEAEKPIPMRRSKSMADIVGGTMAEDKGKAQARAVLDVTLGILYSKANKDKRLGLNVPADWDVDARPDEEVQRPEDRPAGDGLLHQRLRALGRKPIARGAGAAAPPASPCRRVIGQMPDDGL